MGWIDKVVKALDPILEPIGVVSEIMTPAYGMGGRTLTTNEEGTAEVVATHTVSDKVEEPIKATIDFLSGKWIKWIIIGAILLVAIMLIK